MDFSNALKSDVFRPVATIVVPGTIALSPYLLIAARYNPELPTFWNAHGAAFVALFLVAVIATGFALENVGARIESLWDHMHTKKRKAHLRDWYAYLKLELNDQIIAQRYLRSLVTRMKFELTCAPALLVSAIGLVWANAVLERWSWWYVSGIAGFATAVFAYLLWESYCSASLAAHTRKLILSVRKR